MFSQILDQFFKLNIIKIDLFTISKLNYKYNEFYIINTPRGFTNYRID